MARRYYGRRRRKRSGGLARFLGITFASYVYHLFFKTKW